MFKGWIGLDVDGTITSEKYSVPKEVLSYLFSLYKKGWNISIFTGRSYAFSSEIFSCFHFPCYFSFQNGSSLFEMPQKNCLMKRYVSRAALVYLQKIAKNIEVALVVYTGYEQGDKCYWIKNHLSKKYESYIEEIMKRQGQKMGKNASLPEDIKNFPYIKFVGPLPFIIVLAEKLKKDKIFDFSIVKDPFNKNFHVLLITQKGVNKGTALKELIAIKGKRGKVIVAGNDDNDFSLFGAADIKIAMSDAPSHLKESADIIAPPAEENGIISALRMIMEE